MSFWQKRVVFITGEIQFTESYIFVLEIQTLQSYGSQSEKHLCDKMLKNIWIDFFPEF